jgi:hypothetical protein
MATQQIQFYQYRPDSDARHNAVFTPMPSEQPVYSPMAGYSHPPYPAPQYWHPPQFHHPHPQGHFVPQRVMSQQSPPLTLTMPMPKIMIDQRGHMDQWVDHRQSTPPTPSLSACPSSASSPPASSINATPVTAGYFSLPLESSKEEPTLTLPLMEDWTEHTGKLDLVLNRR